jgi:hypothetical protein
MQPKIYWPVRLMLVTLRDSYKVICVATQYNPKYSAVIPIMDLKKQRVTHTGLYCTSRNHHEIFLMSTCLL